MPYYVKDLKRDPYFDNHPYRVHRMRVQGPYFEGHLVSQRIHVPKEYILWPQSTNIETTLRLKYILFGYMDPLGLQG